MVFEFSAYASLECDRLEREARLRHAALLTTLTELRARDHKRPACAPARWLGLLLIRLGRALQRLDTAHRAPAEWE